MPAFKLNSPPASIPPGSTIFAYLRDSGHETQELSTTQQKNVLNDWALQHNLIITRFFEDEMRGTVINRSDLQEMMHALRHGAQEKGVVVWSYARFSRGLDDPVLYRAEIRTLGYTFHSLTDDVPEGPIGRIVEAVIDYKNYQYTVDLSIEIRRGLRDLVQIYRCVPGIPPTGFKKSKPVTVGIHRDGSPRIAHRWVSDPDVTPLVLKAFQMRAAGQSLYAINQETGFFRAPGSYSTFFSNKLYIGIFEFGDITIDDYCEPIVPIEIWNKVQERQAHFQRKQHTSNELDHPRRTTSRYLLSGLLRCPQCDAPINGNTSSYVGGRRANDTYVCTNVRRHKCKSRRIPRELLEQTVINTVKDYIVNPEVAYARQQMDAETHVSSQAQAQAERAANNAKLTKVRKKLDNINEALSERPKSTSLLKKLDELEHEETKLLNKLAETQQATSPFVPLTMDELKRYAEGIIRLLNEGGLDEKRAVLRGIIYRIKVENVDKRLKGIVFYYSPTPKPESIPKDNHDPPDCVSLVQYPPGAQEQTARI